MMMMRSFKKSGTQTHTHARAHSHAQTHPPRYTAHRAKRLHTEHSGGAAVAPGRLEQKQKKKQYGRKQQFSHLVNTVCGSAKKKKKRDSSFLYIYIMYIVAVFSLSLLFLQSLKFLFLFNFLCHVNHRRTYKFAVLSLTERWTKEWTKRKKKVMTAIQACSSSPWRSLQMLFICLIFLSHLISSDLLGLEPIGRFFDATKWSSSASRRAHEWRHPPPPLSLRLHHCLKTTVTLLLCPMIIIVSHCYFESAFFFMYQCVPYLRRGSHQFFIVFLLFFFGICDVIL